MKDYIKLLAIVITSLFATTAVTACGSDEPSQNAATTDVTITCTPDDCHAPASGANLTLSVSVNAKEWTALTETSCDWVKLQPNGTTASSGTIDISVAPNTTNQQRNINIIIKSGKARKIVPLTQDAPLSLGATQLYFHSQGATQTITVNAPSDQWTASASEAWLTTRKANEQTLEVTALANDDLNPRQATITIAYGSEQVSVSITQNGADDRTINEPPVEGYHLVWNDEFANDGSLDATNWRHEVKRSGWVNNERQNYVNELTPRGERVTEIIDGKLHINCIKEDGKIYSGRVYAQSSTGWQYGYVEARIKLPSGKGTWPAFWMMPVNFHSWPHDGEIDIMEEVGYHRDYVSSSLHADGHVHSNGTQVTKEIYCKGAEGEFHTYGMEWTKDYFQFYVDGQKTLYYRNPGTGVRDWPYDAPFYIILNLAWGGDWGGSQGVDETKLPLTMEVDYVRVFQK